MMINLDSIVRPCVKLLTLVALVCSFESESLAQRVSEQPAIRDQRLQNMYNKIEEAVAEEKWSAAVGDLNSFAQRALNRNVNRPDLAMNSYLEKIRIAHTATGPTIPRESWIRTAATDAMRLLNGPLRRNEVLRNALVESLTAAQTVIQQDMATRPFDKLIGQLDMVTDFLSDLDQVRDDADRERQRERAEAVYRRELIASIGGQDDDGSLTQVTTNLEQHIVRLAEIVEDVDDEEREAQLAAIDAYVVGIANLEELREWEAALDTAFSVNEELHAGDEERKLGNYRGFSQRLADRLVVMTENEWAIDERLTSSLLETAELAFDGDPGTEVELLSKVYDIGETLTGWDSVGLRRIELLEQTTGETSAEVIEAMLELAAYRWRHVPLVVDLDVTEENVAEPRLMGQAVSVAEYYVEIARRAAQQADTGEIRLTAHERAASCYVVADRIDEAGEQIEEATAVADMLELPANRRRELSYQAGYIQLRSGETAAAKRHFQEMADTDRYEIDLLTLEGLTMFANCCLIEEDFSMAYSEASRAISLYDQTPEGRQRPLPDASILDQLMRYETLQSVVTLAESKDKLESRMKSRLEVLNDSREFMITSLTQRALAERLPLTTQQLRTGNHNMLFGQRFDLVNLMMTLVQAEPGVATLSREIQEELRSEQQYLAGVIASENAQRVGNAAFEAQREADRRLRHYKANWYTRGGLPNVWEWNGRTYLVIE